MEINNIIEKLKTILFLISLLIAAGINPLVSEGRNLVFASEHWPPWVIIDQKDESVVVGGIDVEILKEIAKRLNLNLKLYTCPWKRCLSWLEYGKIDVLTSVARTPAREGYMQYIDPPYLNKSIKVFYLKQGKGHLIKKYEDLHGISIGVTKGYKYFPRFNNDKRINKHSVVEIEQLLAMLEVGRFQAFIGNEIVVDYLIRENGYSGLFEKSVYKFDAPYEVYMAISKKSVYAKEIADFNKVMKDMVESGKIEQIIKKFLK